MLKFTWKHKKTLNSQSNPEQRKQWRKYQTISDFNLYYRAIVTKQHYTDGKTEPRARPIQATANNSWQDPKTC
jgi:hypothetical protein